MDAKANLRDILTLSDIIVMFKRQYGSRDQALLAGVPLALPGSLTQGACRCLEVFNNMVVFFLLLHVVSL